MASTTTPQKPRRPSGGDAGVVQMQSEVEGRPSEDERDAVMGAPGPDAQMDPTAWRDEIVRTIFGDVGAIPGGSQTARCL